MIAFLVSAFPQLSQTFIYREFESLWRRGQRFVVVATDRTKLGDQYFSDELADIRRHALFLEFRRLSTYETLPRSLRDARQHIAWMAGLPHRTLKHRARGMGAAVVAAHLAPLLRERGVRYVHAHFAGFQTEIAMCLSRMLDIPYGASWHAYDIYRDNNMLREKIAGAKLIASCTEHNVNHLRALAPEHAERIHLAYHGVHLSQFDQGEFARPSAQTTILAIGRLVEKKGFDHLLHAAGHLIERGLSPKVVLIGDGPLRGSLAALAGELPPGTVEFRGSQPQSAVMTALAEARMLVVPSIEGKDGDIDGLPNVVLEAMASRRPVVASAISGIPEALVDGDNGYLVAPGDCEALANRIAHLLANPELADAMGERGYRVVTDRFGADRNADFLWGRIQEACSSDHVRDRRDHCA
jgi:glycosyltransferase involved in cell wall biosynthesis